MRGERSIEGINFDDLIELLELCNDEEIEKLKDSMYVEGIVIKVKGSGDLPIRVKVVPFIVSAFESRINKFLWEYVTEEIITKERRQDELIAWSTDVRVRIQGLSKGEKKEILRSTNWSVDDSVFCKTKELAQLYLYHLDKNFLSEVKSKTLAEARNKLGKGITTSIMMVNAVRDVLNRSLNYQNNDMIGVKMLLAGQMLAAA